MKSPPHSHRPPMMNHGFTLFEAMLALLIFSVAVVALVECINIMGTAGIEARQEHNLQSRLDVMLLEFTRMPLPPAARSGGYNEKRNEDGVFYEIAIAPLELKNKDNAPLTELYSVRIDAIWKEDGREQHRTAETWVHPPLYAPAH